MPILVLAPVTLPLLGPALVAAVAAMSLIKLMCEVSWCRWIGIIGWALMWATLGAGLMALWFAAIGAGLAMALYGGMVSALMLALESGSCRLPRMRAWP